jgi:hypothetical protein
MSYSPLLSFGPSILVPGSAYRFLHLSVFGVPQYPCRRQNLLCPMLTSALRSGCLSTSSVTEATQDSSPGVSSTAFCAQSPDLRSASLMEVDFAVRCPLVRRSRLLSGFCPSTRTFAPRFLQTSLQTSDLAVAIALAFCYPSPPSGWGRTFTSKLLNMPSTQRSRFAADAIACSKQATSEIRDVHTNRSQASASRVFQNGQSRVTMRRS